MSLDAGQQRALSPAARDHVATTERPQKVIVAAHALLWTLSRQPRSQGAPSLPSRPHRGPRPPSQQSRTLCSRLLCPRPPGTMLRRWRAPRRSTWPPCSVDAVATNTASGGLLLRATPQRSQLRRAQLAARQQGGSSEPHLGRMASRGTVTMGTFTGRKSATGTSATGEQARWKESREGGRRTGGQVLPQVRGTTSAEDKRSQGGLVAAYLLYAVILNTERNKVISSNEFFCSFILLFDSCVAAIDPPCRSAVLLLFDCCRRDD